MYLPYLPRIKDQGRTKDEPRNDLRTPKYNMCVLLRLIPKKVDFIPKKVDSSPEIVAYPPNKKSPKKAIFLAHLEKKVYLCAQISKRIDMRSNEISYFISFCIEQYKQKHHLTGEQAMLELDKYGVLEYLEEFYEVLHTQSAQWIVEDIDNYINQRKQ